MPHISSEGIHSLMMLTFTCFTAACLVPLVIRKVAPRLVKVKENVKKLW